MAVYIKLTMMCHRGNIMGAASHIREQLRHARIDEVKLHELSATYSLLQISKSIEHSSLGILLKMASHCETRVL